MCVGKCSVHTAELPLSRSLTRLSAITTLRYTARHHEDFRQRPVTLAAVFNIHASDDVLILISPYRPLLRLKTDAQNRDEASDLTRNTACRINRSI